MSPPTLKAIPCKNGYAENKASSIQLATSPTGNECNYYAAITKKAMNRMISNDGPLTKSVCMK
jgi:hypothetical protein